jgi:hypothetical protein
MTDQERTVKLIIKTIIGTGDPFDAIALIPLISDWGVPNQCINGINGEPCIKTLTRLYVLEQPLTGFGGGPEGFWVVGCCENHHKELSGKFA